MYANNSQTMSEQDIKVRNFELISDALAARPIVNQHLQRFDKLAQEDFAQFCDMEHLTNDLTAIRKINFLQTELQRFANFPSLFLKNLGAIGGGFSSGKSSFINSFLLSKDVKLAEGIQPVTAIPSYIISDSSIRIQGISYKGGQFPISLDMYKDISHKMLKNLQFPLKEIIQYTTVLVPMKEGLFENLCLIDTPGYNAPASGSSLDDRNIASTYAKDAEFLIWLIGLDSNGAFPQSDIEFLTQLDFGKEGGKPLYIIANKADTKTLQNTRDILDDFEEVLDDVGLHYEGICAYSSKQKKIYDTRKLDIHSFLQKYNTQKDVYQQFSNIIHDVFKEYITEIYENSKQLEAKQNDIKKLLMKALETGSIDIDEEENALEDGLKNLIRYFEPKENHEIRMKRAKSLRDRFLECLQLFSNEMGAKQVKKIFCTRCGQPMLNSDKVCIHCNTLQAGDVKKCPKCHSILSLECLFCTECGASLLNKNFTS